MDNIRQLFDHRDPNSFIEKDLDDDAVEYIVSSAQEISPKKVGLLRIVISEKFGEEISFSLKKAVSDYFMYQAHITEKKVKTIFKVGFKSLFIGLCFFSIAVLLSKSISHSLPDGFLGDFVKEGFLLLGWVSMWKPINIFLYEWWPLIDLKRTFIILTNVRLEVCHVVKINNSKTMKVKI